MQDRDEIEVKLAWLENYVLELDGVVRGLAEEVVSLKRELAELRTRSPEDDDDAPSARAYEKPPHY